jgi:hypothetical protein
MDTQFDPFAAEAVDLSTFVSPAVLAPTTEDEVLGEADWLNTLALNAGAWQGDCREQQ